MAATPASPTSGVVIDESDSQSDSVFDVLLSGKAITREQYDQLKIEAVNVGKNPEDLAFENQVVDEEQLARAKAKFYNVPFLDLGHTAASPEALNKLPESVASRYKALPFGFNEEENTLSVAMANPLDLGAVEFIEKKSGSRVIPFTAVESQLVPMIGDLYAESLSTEVTEALKETGAAEAPGVQTVDIAKLGEVIREAPVAKVVATLLEFAIKARASDIHIEPMVDKTRVRYRIDGILVEKLMLPKKVHSAVVSRIKILAGMKIDEKRLPQDGRFNFKAGQEEVDLRVSSLPVVHGEKIVMRLLKKTGNVPTLPELGLRGGALKNLQTSVLVPHGIILITGPTGSGKTTTLYSMLSKISTPQVNIITLEDPVEYEIVGVNQVQVNPKAGLTFASGMRSFLRQDPNIIMVGEIRDTETTELAIQASLTGHLVFSTLHTNSAGGALPRLLDMKAEPFLLASSMTCVVAQRVVRKICEHCKERFSAPPEVLEDVKQFLGSLYESALHTQGASSDAEITLFRGKKCSECGDTGYSGRIGIFEVLPVSEKIGRLILERAPASRIEEQAVADGMVLMKQDGYLKALEGVTTIEEVLRVAEI
ncbi:Flp pilus assembly complex ATPase component TadA [Patescibacteria group bacterium]|nr:Flp pilus assembly complex ATPase component TadA [Patescibacteria group bacterium]